jgi:glycosyltransferase involved in cell wall biosynthesis
MPSPAPLVSVCIPTYNGMPHLEQALASALAQKYPNIEYIVCDDESTDGSFEVATSTLRAAGVRYQVQRHLRSTAPANWNACVDVAQGAYIKFLLQDDLLRPSCVTRMVDIAAADPGIGLVFAPRDLIVESSPQHDVLLQHLASRIGDVHDRWSVPLYRSQSGSYLLQDPNLLKGLNKVGEPSAVLVRRDVFARCGYFDTLCCQLADVEMWIRILARYRVGFEPSIQSTFRIHDRQLTVRNRLTGQQFQDRARVCATLMLPEVWPHLHSKTRRILKAWARNTGADTRTLMDSLG